MLRETWPQLLQEKCRKYGSKRVAMRHKKYGIWEEFSWRDYYDNVKQSSLGLLEMGLKPADRVMLLGYNDPYLCWAILGVMVCGGVAAIFHHDATPLETKYVMEQSNSRFAIVQDQQQVDKLMEIKNELPRLEKIVYWNPRGMSDFNDSALISFDRLLQKGKKCDDANPGFFERLIETSKEDDVAVLLYTAGTGSMPKGVLLTHRAGISSAKKIIAGVSLRESYDIFSHVPLSWFSAFMLEMGVELVNGMTANFPESPDTILVDMREISPQFVFFTPRQWESLVTQVKIRVGDADFLKRLCFHLFLPIGYAMHQKQGGTNFFLKLLYYIASLVLFRPLKRNLGLHRVNSSLTGGAPISQESFKFLNSLALNLKQIYGLTEINPVTCQDVGDRAYKGVGVPVKNTEVKISKDGEIIVRGDHMCQGYLKNSEATDVLLKDGWIRTGDIGEIDTYGNLIYYGKVSDMMQLGNGKSLSLTYIEDKLRFSPFIKDAIVIRKGSIIALIQINFENVGKWAEKNNISYTTFSDLSQKLQTEELVRGAINEVNKGLPEEVRVESYFLFDKELNADESELTRSGKLRKDFIIAKYRYLWAKSEIKV
jgi:long-chain acyl-CoA synthetase